MGQGGSALYSLERRVASRAHAMGLLSAVWPKAYVEVHGT